MVTGIIEIVGNRVRTYRQKAGLSQSELGELAGLHNTYIGQIERGEKNVSLEAIDKVITALNLPYEVFFAKIKNIGNDRRDMASECYEQIISMDSKQQRLLLNIIENIQEMMKP